MVFKYGVAIKGDWKLIAYFKTKEEAEKYIKWNKCRITNLEVRKIIG